MMKKQTEKKNFTRFVSRKSVAELCSRDSFTNDALRRIAERGKDIQIAGARVFVTFGDNTYEIKGAEGLAEMLEKLAYEGEATENNKNNIGLI